MKKLTKLFAALFGIIAVSAIIIFALAFCQQEPESNGNNPELPAYLQNTTWINKHNDKVAFDAAAITITTDDGEYTYAFKEAQYIEQQDRIRGQEVKIEFYAGTKTERTAITTKLVQAWSAPRMDTTNNDMKKTSTMKSLTAGW